MKGCKASQLNTVLDDPSNKLTSFASVTIDHALKQFASLLLCMMLPEIKSAVRDEIAAKKVEEIEQKLLSPSETCKLFSPPISKPTLSSWTKSGFLKDYRISGRVYYRASEVIEAAKHLKKYQKQAV